MSPVWIMKSGAFAPLILSMAFDSVPVTSGFAPLLKPMWLSLICTKEKSSVLPADADPPLMVWASRREVGIPPTMDQRRPVPAQAMQPRKLRRSMPSLVGVWGAISSCWKRFMVGLLALHEPEQGRGIFIPWCGWNFWWE